MADFNSVNPKLRELLFTALDHGIDSIKDGGGPLIPFLITDTNGERSLNRFVTDKLEEAPGQAKAHLQSLDPQPDLAVIAFDGYITLEGTKYDAIFADGYEKHVAHPIRMMQRYKPKKFLSKFKTIGNAGFLGAINPPEQEEEKGGDTIKFLNYCYILFNNDNLKLEQAAAQLKESNLKVAQNGHVLDVSWKDGPVLHVAYEQGDKVLQESKALGTGTSYADQLATCNARYVIGFEDLYEVLDEINTLIDVQTSLQELTNGVQYNSWNDELN